MGRFFGAFMESVKMKLLSIEKERKRLPENISSIEEVILYLTGLNDNVMVYVKKVYHDVKANCKIYEMSNGQACSKNTDGKWSIV